MAEIKDYSVTADDNNSASPNGMPENMAPSGVNNSWRESFARVKRWYEDINATKSTTGSSNAYVLAAARTVAAYAQGDAYMFRANHANTGAATLNVDSVGAVAIVNVTQSALAAGQIQSGGIYLVAYDATNTKFQLVGASATSASGDNIFVFNASPSVTLENSTAEDSDGGRESSFLFKGLQSGSEESTLVKIIGSHDGSSDDQKGKLQIYTNDGSDGDSPTLQVTIDSAGLCTLVAAASVGGSLTVAGATQLNSTVTVGANDQGYDVILYGDTASANVTWDTSVDDLILNGAAGLIVPDGQLTLGATAVTSTGAELNILDGVTASTAELNILDGVTSTTAELNILDGVTSTTAELNILDGVTSTTAELNILDGVTSTAAELNYLDITTLGTTQASKVVTTDSNGDVVFPDGDKINLGTGSDLVLQHDGSNGSIVNSTGDLYISDAGGNIYIQAKTGEQSIVAFADGAVDLYHNNAKKLETHASGVLMNTTSELQFSTTAYGIRASTGLEIKTGDFTRFLKGTTEYMRILDGGNVSIGETATTARLDVHKSSVVAAELATATNGHFFSAQSDDNTDAFEIYQQHGSNATRKSFVVNDNRTGSKSAAFTIQGDGRMGIASTGLGAVQVAVVINGMDWFFVCDADDGTDKFRVASTGNVQNANNSYGAISDSKLKENIVDASNKLENLKQVKIRNFNFKGDSQKQIGVVAQELETIFPSMVENHKDRDKDGNDLGTTTKSVKYSVFVPMLIKAMQEQQTVIEALEARITALEAK